MYQCTIFVHIAITSTFQFADMFDATKNDNLDCSLLDEKNAKKYERYYYYYWKKAKFLEFPGIQKENSRWAWFFPCFG